MQYTYVQGSSDPPSFLNIVSVKPSIVCVSMWNTLALTVLSVEGFLSSSVVLGIFLSQIGQSTSLVPLPVLSGGVWSTGWFA